MRESNLRDVLLVQAIEEADLEGTVLPRADREQSTRAALRDTPLGPEDFQDGRASPRALATLAARAAALRGRLVARFPVIERVMRGAYAVGWLDAAMIFLALLLGFSMSAIDAGRRINILAFPLLGLVVWNVLVLVALGLGRLRRARGRPVSPSRGASWYRRVAGSGIRRLITRSAGYHATLATALGSFAGSWGETGSRLLLARAQRLFHAAAAMVAIGLVVGLYLRGVVFQFDAGWESTFLGPEQVQPILRFLYGPAAAITGLRLPATLAETAALRWTGSGSGVDAAAWIHLLAVTALLFIVVPRAAAALLAHVSLKRLETAAAIPVSTLAYARRTLGGAAGVPGFGICAVTPYAADPSPGARRALEALVAAALGEATTVDLRGVVRYGEEDAWLESLDSGAGRVADCHLLLFNLAATPESENHGAMLAGARDWLTRSNRAGQLLVLIDETDYLRRFGTDPGMLGRIDERRRLWRKFVADHGLTALIVRLDEAGADVAPEQVAAARAALWTAGQDA